MESGGENDEDMAEEVCMNIWSIELDCMHYYLYCEHYYANENVLSSGKLSVS